MSQAASRGTVTVFGKTWAVLSAELVIGELIERDGTCMTISMEVYAGVEEGDTITDGGVFRLDEVPIGKVECPLNLDGARMHFFGGQEEPEDDDTLGTTPPDAFETSQWCFGYDDKDFWSYDEMQVDFRRIEGTYFLVHVKCRLRNSESGEIEDAVGEFTVQCRQQLIDRRR